MDQAGRLKNAVGSLFYSYHSGRKRTEKGSFSSCLFFVSARIRRAYAVIPEGKKGRSDWKIQMKYGRILYRFATAVLVFFAAAARTRIVSADLFALYHSLGVFILFIDFLTFFF